MNGIRTRRPETSESTESRSTRQSLCSSIRSRLRSTIQIIRSTNAGSSRLVCRRSSDSCSLHRLRGARTAFGSSAPDERRAEKTMRTKNEAPSLNDDLRPEYDLSKLTGGVRGKYYKRAT